MVSFSSLGPPLLGGALVGLGASLLLLSHGKVAGISGVYGGLLQQKVEDHAYRIWFLGGLVLAGIVARFLMPEAFGAPVTRNLWWVALAGLLVGWGTRRANGCTSGHGVCGLSRFSVRSLVAVVTFIFTGMITTLLVRA